MKKLSRFALALLGLLLLAFLVWRVGPASVAASFMSLGVAGFALVFLLGGVSHAVKSAAWWFNFEPSGRAVTFRQLLGIRLAGEAVGQLTFAGQVTGEATRALMLRRSVETQVGISAVVLDRALFTFTALLFIVAGSLTSFLFIPLPGETQRYNLLIALVMLTIALLGGAAVHWRWKVLAAPLSFLGTTGWRGRLAKAVEGIETSLHSFYHCRQSDFRKAFALNVLGHFLSVAEVFLILAFLGLNPSFVQAFLIEALTKVVNFGTLVIPGNLGASEGGNMVILSALGMGASNGLTLALARRLRGLSWAVVGMVVLYIHGTSFASVAVGTSPDRLG